MEEKKSSSVSDVGAWAMNIISSTGIIMANKQLMYPTGFYFAFATTLTGLHFSMTALVGLVSNASGYSASKHIPLWELVWFSIVANVSITGVNLSLMLNSVGFYRISNLSMISVACAMEWFLHGKHYSREVKMAVMIVVVGVGVCTVTDVNVNARGFLCACVASIGSLQKKYSIGSFELLSKTAPIQQIHSLITTSVVNLYQIMHYHRYLCTGRFSAVSFQVLGHMKTVCVLKLGWIVFDSEMTVKNVIGMAVAVAGMVVYSWAVGLEKQTRTKFILALKPNLSQEEKKEKTPLIKDVELG
ncbi:hypothetical protein P3X46_007089 [Hevea brasiliensis]|uniref:Sugar phosphate transporter domain-containing protein n=1 Tax=Hevea brasiliensis TaxID=3981 RepID=A0ABQ9MWE9_HEVBR|nr:hypothetical protein P3X46_007089 [Hevea brasiliensis]